MCTRTAQAFAGSLKVTRDESPAECFLSLAEAPYLPQGHKGTEQIERMRIEAADPSAAIFLKGAQIICFASGRVPLEFAIVEDLLPGSVI